MTDTLLADLLPSWQLHLKAEHKSKSTVDGYRWGVHVFLKWCSESGTPPVLDKSTVQTFLVSLLDSGAQAATARTRYAALRRYGAWLADEGELPSNPLADMKPPKLDDKIIQPLTDDQLKKLINACKGPEFIDRRDEAIVRFMAETATRSSEAINMIVDDVDLPRGIAVVRKGKGGKGRVVAYGAQTAQALDRYVRIRRTHRQAETGKLWLGGGHQGFGYHGLDRALKIRANAAGIPDFKNHRLRSTAATRWLDAGGSEQGLMSIAGWSTRSMLDRYTKASASDRAVAEAQRLSLGDL